MQDLQRARQTARPARVDVALPALHGVGPSMSETFLEALRADRRPLLTREQEAALGRRIRAGGLDGERAHRELVERNLRLAVNIAKKHRNRGLDFEELVQAAALGVMHAAHKYDPELGWKFSGYCTWWCRHEIGRALQNTSRTVRLTAPVHGDLQLIRKAERALLTTTSDEITPALLAAETGLPEARVVDVMAYGQPMASLNRNTSRYGNVSEEGEYIPDPGPAPDDLVADTIRDEALARALATLPYRQRRVLVMRHGLYGEAEHTLDQCAALFRIQREQARIIQQRAEAALAAALS